MREKNLNFKESHRPTLFLCSVCFDWAPSEKESYQRVGVCQECMEDEPIKEDINDDNYYKGRGDRDTDEL